MARWLSALDVLHLVCKRENFLCTSCDYAVGIMSCSYGLPVSEGVPSGPHRL